MTKTEEYYNQLVALAEECIEEVAQELETKNLAALTGEKRPTYQSGYGWYYENVLDEAYRRFDEARETYPIAEKWAKAEFNYLSKMKSRKTKVENRKWDEDLEREYVSDVLPEVFEAAKNNLLAQDYEENNDAEDARYPSEPSY